jgi:hypothetical protein
MSSGNLKTKESLRTRAEILNIPLRCGGFNNLETFRQEVPEAAHIGDEEAHAIILEQMEQRAKMPVESKILLDNYDGPKENYVDNELRTFTRQSYEDAKAAREDAKFAQNLANEEAQRRARELREEKMQHEKNMQEVRMQKERELREERNKNTRYNTIAYTINDPFEFNRLRLYNHGNDTVSYLAKERIKRELKEELEDERRKAALQREINAIRIGVSRSNTRSKSKPKARPKSKAKSKLKAKPKSKSKAAPKAASKSSKIKLFK